MSIFGQVLEHQKVAKKVLRHLQGTKGYIMYQRSDSLEVISYLDSDFVGCIDSCKSAFGYIFVIVNRAISWRSAKQSLVATSTMEAEFVSLFEASSQRVFGWNNSLLVYK